MPMKNSQIDQEIAELQSKLGSLAPHNQNFAKNLIKFYSEKDNLSTKQYYWVNQLINQANTAPYANVSAASVQPPVKDEGEIEVGKLTKLEELFDRAKKKLKMPAVIFNVTDVGLVMVGVPYNNQKGLDVCIKNGPYGYKYVGTVEDEFFFPKNRWYQTPSRILELLKALSNDPITTLTEYGKSSGICAICGSGLEDPDSIKRGIGPVCAKNYGLENIFNLTK